MSVAETRDVFYGTGRCPVPPFYICLVSAEDICLVSTANICPVSTADICHVSTENICPVSIPDFGSLQGDFMPTLGRLRAHLGPD